MGVGNLYSNSDLRSQPQLEGEVAEAAVDNTFERLGLVCQKLASAAPEEVAADSIPETGVQKFQKLPSGAKALGLAQMFLRLVCADPEAEVGNTHETPVRGLQKQAYAEVWVRNPGTLLPRNALAAEVEEGNRNPEPLL